MSNRALPYFKTRRPAWSAEVAPSAPATQERVVSDCVDERDPRWDILLLCVAAYILTSVGRVHQLFPALELIRPAAMTGVLAIVIYLLDAQDERRATHLGVSTTQLIIGLTIWMVLSVPIALRSGNSFTMVFGNFIKTALMYFVIAGSVRGIRDVERLTFAYLAGAVLYASVVITRFAVGEGEAWRLGRLYYYDANDFATFAVTAMPFGLYFLHAARRPLGRVLAAGGLALLALGFVRAGSRGGFVALAAVACFIVLRYTAIPLRWRLSAAALVGLVLLGTASDQFWRQMGTILSDTDYNRTHESGRFQIWNRGVGYMLQNPVLGLGPGNFQVAEGTLSPLADRQQFGVGVRWNAPHNSFIQAGAELGLPGLMLFVAMIASAFRALNRSNRNEQPVARLREGRPHLAPALTASLIGFVVGSFFLSLAYSEMLYTLVAFAVGMQRVTSNLGTEW